MALRPASSSAPNPAARAGRTNSGHSAGPRSALIARPALQPASSTWATISSRRRSMASTADRPVATRRSAGRAGLATPGRRRGTSGSAQYTWYGTATVVSWVPSTDTSSPRTRQRRSRERRSGDRSMSTRRAVRRSVPSPNVASSRARARPVDQRSRSRRPRRSRSRRSSGAGPGGPAEPVTATRRRHHQTAGAEGPAKGRCAPRGGGEPGRSLPFCCGTRDNRATDRDDCGWPVPPQAPRIVACEVPAGAVPRSGAAHGAGRKGMGKWRR